MIIFHVPVSLKLYELFVEAYFSSELFLTAAKRFNISCYVHVLQKHPPWLNIRRNDVTIDIWLSLVVT